MRYKVKNLYETKEYEGEIDEIIDFIDLMKVPDNSDMIIKEPIRVQVKMLREVIEDLEDDEYIEIEQEYN